MSPRAALLTLVLAAGCAHRAAAPAGTPFRLPADGFAFANQTVWEYRIEPGRFRWSRRVPRPAFALRCGNMARAARQFHVHARFDPALPPADAAAYDALVRQVVARSPRRQDPSRDPVVIPGFADLRSFSRAHEALLKNALGGAWRSYVQRGNWRMIFPFTAGHQRRTAAHLRAAVAAGRAPIVHVLRYPRITLNHFVVVFAARETPAAIYFEAYDPNDADAPILITWERRARTFVYARTPYFPGGPVRAYEIYDGPFS